MGWLFRMLATAIRTEAGALGRYYTAESTAAFVSRLVLRAHSDQVLDPSCGTGVFLVEAANRLQSLSPRARGSVTGIDLDRTACSCASASIQERPFSIRTRIMNRDFFSVSPHEVGETGVIIGNPPFVRYQGLGRADRNRALLRAEKAGVVLSERSNLWAPFVVHATSFLNEGGRLALVLPAELLHANYAAPVMSHLLSSFSKVRILTFENSLFPTLEVEAIVLLAEGLGSKCTEFRIVRIDNPSGTRQWAVAEERRATTQRMDDGGVAIDKVSDYFLPGQVREVFRKVRNSGLAKPLSRYASVDIGYVTGDHGFFHLTKEGARKWGIPGRFLKPALRRGRSLSGCIYQKSDWGRLKRRDAACFLLRVPPDAPPESIKRLRPYLREGIRRGVDSRYQCRVREPWYSVKRVRTSDGILTPVASGSPRLLLNEAGVFPSNNLHTVTCEPDVDRSLFTVVVCSWYSSFTAISAMLEGRVLGGGLRKLEPSEAERVEIIMPQSEEDIARLKGLIPVVDASLRGSGNESALNRLDDLLLTETVGLSGREQEILRNFRRRYGYSKTTGVGFW